MCLVVSSGVGAGGESLLYDGGHVGCGEHVEQGLAGGLGGAALDVGPDGEDERDGLGGREVEEDEGQPPMDVVDGGGPGRAAAVQDEGERGRGGAGLASESGLLARGWVSEEGEVCGGVRDL